MSHRSRCTTFLPALALVALGAGPAGAARPAADPLPAPSRGELLYATHCIACHTEQIHWRDRKLARDWTTLRTQVDRWQQAARLGWSAEDIEAVTHHLNETVYGFPRREAQAIGLPAR